MAWPTIPSWTSGEVVTSADLNALRDALNAIGDAWTAFTPSWTASTTSPTLGTTVVAGSYRLMGKTADVHITIAIGTGFSAGSGAYRFSLPAGVTPLRVNALETMGYAMALDSPSTGYKANAYLVSTTTVGLLGDTGVWGNATPIAWANGDRISIHIPSLELA